MADYYGKTRTNYFSVTDEEKFRKIMALCVATDDIKIEDENQNDGSVKYVFYCEGVIQGLPDIEDDDGNAENYDDDIDYNYDAFCKALQQILPDDDAIIITEVGSEKMRYLTGICTIITNKEFRCLDIAKKAVNLARVLLKNSDYTTEMYY